MRFVCLKGELVTCSPAAEPQTAWAGGRRTRDAHLSNRRGLWAASRASGLPLTSSKCEQQTGTQADGDGTPPEVTWLQKVTGSVSGAMETGPPDHPKGAGAKPRRRGRKAARVPTKSFRQKAHQDLFPGSPQWVLTKQA